MRIGRYILIVIFIGVFLSGCATTRQEVSYVKSVGEEGCEEHILYGYPGTDCTILCRGGYVLCHNNDKKVADWVSYHLTDKYLVKRVRRTNDFRTDPQLPKGQRSELKDYSGSGYDKGHLAPAGDMTRAKKIMSESFLLSNMSPQVGIGFNRGIWKKLEDDVRGWAEEKKNLYIMTGPVYENENDETIGSDKVAVPPSFYKIIIACDETGQILDSISFILPNEKNPNDMLPLFITTIDEIEDKTGLDFLSELRDDIEDEIEVKKAEMW